MANDLKFTAQYPLDDMASASKWCAPDVICGYASKAEELGYSAIAFTEHPAPTKNWITGVGGHAALDPFVALTLCGSCTTVLGLVTYLAIAPYRNPLLLAKSAVSVDLLSGGRLLLGLGAGYLDGEFRAMGVEREERAMLLRETIEILPKAWSGQAFSARGHHFDASDVVISPAPERPIPIWLGGNSRTVRRWVAECADGWAPLLADSAAASRAGTQPLSGPEALAAAVRELHEIAQAMGRDAGQIQVQVKGPASRIRAGFDPSRQLDEVAALAAAGATYFVVHPLAEEPTEALDIMVEYGETVVRPYRKGVAS
ncbi:MAG TPA: TIGR03619 family F420-dependent LLM class oxidoreductase [Acidimicrobiales bacterium]|nr:TIGR03619 family F420-dependent LLM class oxidoreductase [Acidimicrobiales bacterium]